MKRIRIFCLIGTMALLLENPDLLWAGEPKQCCDAFQDHCDAWCSANGHGTGLITACQNTLNCDEVCICTGLCGGVYCEHADPEGSYCADECGIPEGG